MHVAFGRLRVGGERRQARRRRTVRQLRIAIPITVAVIVVSSCQAATPKSFTSATALASAIGCGKFVPDEPSAGDASAGAVKEGGQCKIDDDVVRVYVFDDQPSRDAFMLKDYGNSVGHIAGTQYYVSLSPGLVKQVANKVHAPLRGTG